MGTKWFELNWSNKDNW